MFFGQIQVGTFHCNFRSSHNDSFYHSNTRPNSILRSYFQSPITSNLVYFLPWTPSNCNLPSKWKESFILKKQRVNIIILFI